MCRELGIARSLTKPVRESDLLDAIRWALGKRKIEAASSSNRLNEIAVTTNPRRILLAEDGQVNQKLAVRLLERRGHCVVVANDGKEALQALDREHFDLVLMDVQMPEMDGYEATAAIRQRERTTGRHLRIIAMTAHALKGDREQCLQAGMDDYLAKPVHASELYDAVEAEFFTENARGV